MDCNTKIFVPVKFLDKQWAEKLLDGSVFMRSLFEFGSWNIDAKAKGQAEEMDNYFRGDVGEGLVRNIDPQKGDDFFNSLPPDLRAVIKNAYYIDHDFFQYTKIYSMYCLTYNLSKKQFEIPDERLREFGDTAVIITNPNEFLHRVFLSLDNRFGDNINFKIREVFYYDIFKDFGEFDMFWKEKRFSWQNEIRMAIGILDGKETRTDDTGRILKALIKDTSPLTLEIGDIRDIAIAVSCGDFLQLKLPPNILMSD